MSSLCLIHSGASSATSGSRNPAGCWFVCFLFFFFLVGADFFLLSSVYLFNETERPFLISFYQCLHRPRPKSFSGAQGASQELPGIHPPGRLHTLCETPRGRCSSEHTEAPSRSLGDAGRLGGVCVTTAREGSGEIVPGRKDHRGQTCLGKQPADSPEEAH